MPLYIGRDDPLGSLWVVSEAEGHFNQGLARVTTELAAFVGSALRVQRTEDRLRQALERQEILTKEMSHRVKNVCALTNSMIRLGAKGAQSVHEFAAGLSHRLQAMGSAHELVLRDHVVSSDWDLVELIHTVAAPHHDRHLGPRFSLSGPSVACQAGAVSAMALIVSELATNAVKYGALSDAGGRVAIDWRILGDDLVLTWKEHGGSIVKGSPSHVGFGSQLLDMTISHELGGTHDKTWHPDGLIMTLRLPTARVLA